MIFFEGLLRYKRWFSWWSWWSFRWFVISFGRGRLSRWCHSTFSWSFQSDFCIQMPEPITHTRCPEVVLFKKYLLPNWDIAGWTFLGNSLE